MINSIDNIKSLSQNQLIPYYLMSCYLYYVQDKPALEDRIFDALCIRIQEEWNQIEHRHKSLITLKHVQCQTGYDLNYPTIVLNASEQWYQTSKES